MKNWLKLRDCTFNLSNRELHNAFFRRSNKLFVSVQEHCMNVDVYKPIVVKV